MRAFSALDAVLISAAARYLASWLATVPPETLAEWVRSGEDLAARFPRDLTLPNLGLTRGMLARYLRTSVDEDWYEALRLELGRYLPVHAAMLGLEQARPWYHQQMNKVREVLLERLVAADAVHTCEQPTFGSSAGGQG